MTLSSVASEESFVDISLVGGQLAIVIKCTILKVAFVDRASWNEQLAATSLASARIGSLVGWSIDVSLTTLTVWQTLFPSARVSGAIRSNKMASSVASTRLEAALVVVAILRSLLALALRLALPPLTFVSLSITCNKLSLTMALSSLIFAFIDGTILVDKSTMAVWFTVLYLSSEDITVSGAHLFDF